MFANLKKFPLTDERESDIEENNYFILKGHYVICYICFAYYMCFITLVLDVSLMLQFFTKRTVVYWYTKQQDMIIANIYIMYHRIAEIMICLFT